jgi:hypothetical protein
MRSIQLRPEYVIVLKYDILPGLQERYFRYIMGEFVPAMQDMGFYMHRAWHVVWGDYPERHIEFITENRDIHAFLEDDRWLDMEEHLQEFITNYTRKVLKYTGTFVV